MRLHARNRIESSAQSRAQYKCPTSSAKYLWLLEVTCWRLLQRKLLQTVLPVILSGGFSEVILAFEKSYVFIFCQRWGNYDRCVASGKLYAEDYFNGNYSRHWCLSVAFGNVTPNKTTPNTHACHSPFIPLSFGSSSCVAGW